MKHQLIGILAKIFMGILLWITLSSVFMTLWNMFVPDIFHLERICFIQALGLIVMSRILFGNYSLGIGATNQRCEQCNGSGFQHHKHNIKERIKDKITTMSPEDREKFKSDMKKACCQDVEENFDEMIENEKK